MYSARNLTLIIYLTVWHTIAGAQNGAGQYMNFATESLITLKCSDCELQGSLMMPEGDSVTAVVLMLSGEGPTDRDGNQIMIRTNVLKMLAIELAYENIASVRFDKRGVGASHVQPIRSEDIRMEHFINDARDWISMLRKDRRFSQIIVLGHGEGSLIALAAAADNRYVNAVISISGMGRTLDQVLRDQVSDQPFQIRNIANQIIDTLKAGHTVEPVPVFLTSMFTPAVQPFIISSMKYNPQVEARHIKVPMLVISGETDMEVRVEDARLLAAANGHARLVVIPDMNHVMKNCPTTDRSIQLMTYFNPTLPINHLLVYETVHFIKTLK